MKKRILAILMSISVIGHGSWAYGSDDLADAEMFYGEESVSEEMSEEDTYSDISLENSNSLYIGEEEDIIVSDSCETEEENDGSDLSLDIDQEDGTPLFEDNEAREEKNEHKAGEESFLEAAGVNDAAETVCIMLYTGGGGYYEKWLPQGQGYIPTLSKEYTVEKGTIIRYLETPIPYEGMTFLGWRRNGEGTDFLTPDPDTGEYFTATEDMKLHAIWSGGATVTWDYNGGHIGEQTSATETVPIGRSVSGYSHFPAYEGHTLMGWSTEPDGDVVIDLIESDNTHLEITQDTTLYARWSEPVTVTWDFNGGTEGGNETISMPVEQGEEVYGSSYEPQRTGYALAGWGTQQNGDVIYDCSDCWRVKQSITYYAIWVPGCTIIFEPNGGKWENGDATPRQEVFAIGEGVIWGFEPEHDTLAFTGWNSSPDGTGAVSFGGYIEPTEDITLYAQWDQACTVTLDANGGYFDEIDDTIETVKVPVGEALGRLYHYIEHSNDSLIFLGWSLSKDSKDLLYNDVFNEDTGYGYVVNENITVYAIWVPYHRVRLFGNGKRIGGKLEECIDFPKWPESIVDASTFIPDDLKDDFVGWSTTQNGTSLFDFDTQAVTSDMDLYAVWKENMEQPATEQPAWNEDIRCNIDEIQFPDDRFREYVLANIDVDNDGKLSTDEIEETRKMNLSNLNINDLRGLSFFSYLSELDCSNNNIKELHLYEAAPYLCKLNCSNNNITDFTLNYWIEELDCSDNSISSIELTGRTGLHRLDCENNQISSIDISDCPELVKAYRLGSYIEDPENKEYIYYNYYEGDDGYDYQPFDWVKIDYGTIIITPTPDASGKCGENLSWKVEDSVLTISGQGEMYNYDYNEGNKKGSSPWESDVTDVIIENGVTSIGAWAFFRCNLNRVVIPDSIEIIGAFAFGECRNLQNVSIPQNVFLEFESFKGCDNLRDVLISDGVESNGNPFGDCDLLKTVGPVGGDYNIQIGWKNHIPDEFFASFDTFEYDQYGHNGIKNITLPPGIEAIGMNAFYGCEDLESVSFPKGLSVVEKGAFENCHSLLSISIPDSLTYIGENAFCGCKNIEQIYIPDSVTYIGSGAFSDCVNLYRINLPDSIKDGYNYVDNSAGNIFSGCTKLISVGPSGSDANIQLEWTNSVPSSFFAGMENVISIELPNGVTTIGEYAFAQCPNLSTIVFPSSISEVAQHIFSGDQGYYNDEFSFADNGSDCRNLKTLGPIGSDANIQLGDMQCIAPHMFESLPLESVIIQGEIKKIDGCAFAGCYRLKSVIIEEGVEKIANNAFHYCINLTELVIPSSVLKEFDSRDGYSYNNGFYSEGSYFVGCNKLKTVGPINSSCNIRIATYEGSIPSYLFYRVDSIESVMISNEVTWIKKEAFRECKNLKRLIISGDDDCGWEEGNSFATESIMVDEYAFKECVNLETIEISGNSDYMRSLRFKEDAFVNCDNITKVVISGNYKYIDDYGLSWINGFKSVTNAGSIGGECGLQFGWTQTIPENAFRHAINIKSVDLPDSVTEIGKGAFYGCEGLQFLIIPDGVTEISDYSFYGCSDLDSVIIPERIGRIGEYAFYNNRNLITIELPDSIEDIGKGAFNGCGFSECILPNKTTVIKQDTIANCEQLTVVSIPISVRSIERNNFSNCPKLSEIYYEGSKAQWDQIQFGNDVLQNLKNVVIHFDGVKLIKNSGILKQGEGWRINWETTHNESIDGVKSNVKLRIYTIGMITSSFIYMKSEIGDGNTMPWLQDEYGFTKDMIENIHISGGCLYVIPDQFREYSNLKIVTLHGVYGISSGAFMDCQKLTGVNIEDSMLTTVEDAAFKNDYKLSSFGFGTELSSLTYIGKEAFLSTGLIKLGDIDNIQSIGNRAFYNAKLEKILLRRGVSTIGADAFIGCDSLVITCYSRSVAHNYAVDNNIRYELIDHDIINDGHVIATVEGPFENCVFETNSKEYNPDLSFYLACLARAVYTPSDIEKSIENLGFHMIDSNYSDGVFDLLSGYVIAKKRIGNNSNLVLISIRGSVVGSAGTNWINLLNLGPSVSGLGKYWAMENDATKVYNALTSKLNGVIDYQNTTFVITGHSQGAGAANLLEVKLKDNGISPNNIYGYNFACPNVACLINQWDWNPNGENDNIFNICNTEDPVPYLPSNAVHKLARIDIVHTLSAWGKFGRTMWFTPEENHSSVGHDMLYYVAEMRKLSNQKDYSNTGDSSRTPSYTGRAVFCPVDVTVYDSNMNAVAGVVGNEPNYYNSEIGNVLIFIDGDHKVFYLPKNEQYTLKFNAYDSGEMTYVAFDINLAEGIAEDYKIFSDVQLETGKKMISKDEEINTAPSDVNLYVIGNNNNTVAEIHEDGSETPLHHDHVWDNGTVTIVPTCVKTGVRTYTCTLDSSHKKTEIIPATGIHIPVIDSAVSPTYTTTGLTDGSHCLVCGMIIVPQTVVPTLTTINSVNAPQTVVPTLTTINSVNVPQIDFSETYNITIQKKPVSVKAKAKKSKITVSWKKLKLSKKTKAIWKQIQKIEVQYSTDVAFQMNVRSKFVGKKKAKVVVSGQKNMTYYIRIRYTDGTGGYSEWSGVKRVRIK